MVSSPQPVSRPSAWSTRWVNPYIEATPADELWRRTCADINLSSAAGAPPKHFGSVGHLHAKKFGGPLSAIEGWPTHVLSGLAGEKTFYFFPDGAGAASKSLFIPSMRCWVHPEVAPAPAPAPARARARRPPACSAGTPPPARDARRARTRGSRRAARGSRRAGR